MPYLSIPRRQTPRTTAGEWWESEVVVRDVTVDDNPDPKPTGLMDAHGDPIYRVRDRIGF
jgi:hypothetical protein